MLQEYWFMDQCQSGGSPVPFHILINDLDEMGDMVSKSQMTWAGGNANMTDGRIQIQNYFDWWNSNKEKYKLLHSTQKINLYEWGTGETWLSSCPNIKELEVDHAGSYGVKHWGN